MNYLKKMKVGHKLALLPIVFTLSIITILIMNNHFTIHNTMLTNQIQKKDYIFTEISYQLSSFLKDMQLTFEEAVLINDINKLKSAKEILSKIDETLNIFNKTEFESKDTLILKIDKNIKDYYTLATKISTMQIEHKFTNSELNNIDLLNNLSNELNENFRQLRNRSEAKINSSFKTILNYFKLTSFIIGGTVIFMIIITVLASIILNKVITKPIIEIASQINNLAEGQLNTKLDEDQLQRSDEIGQIFKSYNYLRHKLSQVVYEINTNTNILTTASNDLEASAETTNESATNQAASLEEISARTMDNAATSKDLFNKSEILTKHAIKLNSTISYFKL